MHRIIDFDVNGKLTDRPVVSFSVQTGHQTIATTIVYDTLTATTDPSGMVANYHKVTTSTGTGNGYQETYYVNGIPASNYLKPLLEGNGSNMLSNLEILRGVAYKDIIYKDDGTQIRTTETKIKVTTFSIGSYDNGYLVRPVQTLTQNDGYFVTQEQYYNNSGQLIRSAVTNSDGKQHMTDYKFASELGVYSEMKLLYNLDPVVQVNKWVEGKIISSEVTTWMPRGTYWAPNKTFLWKYKENQTTFPLFNFSLWSESINPQPREGWVKTSEILERTAMGSIVVSQDMNGNYQSIQYQTIRELPIAVYKFAKINNTTVGADCSNLNFEDSYNCDNWTIGSVPQVELSEAEAHTGNFSLRVKGKVSGGSRTLGFIREFEPTDLKGKYLVSFWYKTESGYTANSAKLIFHVKGTGTDTTNISVGYVGSYVSGDKVLPSATNWSLIQTVLDLNAATGNGTGYRMLIYMVNNDGNQKSVYIDDFRVSPLLSEVKTTVFDPVLQIPVATMDDNNEATYPIYNSSYQVISGLDRFGVVTSIKQSYLSRSGSLTDEYSPSDPNTDISVIASNGGTWNHFNNGSISGLSLSNVSKDTKQLKHTTLGTEGVVTFSLLTGTDYAVRLNFKNETPLNLNPVYKFSIGNVVIQRTATNWSISGVATPLSITATSLPVWTDLLVIVKGTRLYVFANGKIIAQLFHSTVLTGIVKFTFGSNTQGRLDDIIVLNKPQLSVSFSDGIGRPIQNQSLVGNDLIVKGQVYDEVGRFAVDPKAIKYSGSNSLFGYKASYITGFNFVTDAISGEILSSNQYPEDGNYPYSRKVYEPSPLNRIIISGRHGSELNISSGKNSIIRSGNQISQDIMTGINNTDYQLSEVIDYEGTRNISVKDKLGREIYQLKGPLNTYNKVLTINKLKQSDQIFSRSNQTITWQVTFGIMGDDPPSAGQYRWVYFTIGTSENASDKVYEYYQIPGNTQNLITTRSGSFSALEGQTFYCKLFFVSQDGGVIEATANITYQEEDFVITKTEYDVRGNVTSIYTPNYYKVPFSGFSSTAYVQRAGYDAWNRKTWSWTIESDTTRFSYDNSGRLRFQVDAKYENTRPQKDTVNYFKYDKIGRLAESGFFVTDFETIDSIKANNPDYPGVAENPVWKTKNFYDGELSGTSFVLKRKNEVFKRLHKNDDTESESSAIVETWTFDQQGFLQAKSLSIPSYKTGITYNTLYYYNSNKQVSRIDYPTNTLSVRYSYDDFGRINKIGTASDDDYFAAYSYDQIMGSIRTEQIATSTSATKTVTYSYNPIGLLTSVSSPVFSETLSYYSGREGDNLGYYDGKISSSFSSFSWTSGPAIPTFYTIRYKYDKAGRLTSANYYGSDPTLENSDIGVGMNNETAYDMNGNILKLKEGTAIAQQHMYYSGRNQIKNVNGTTSQDYVYDLNGNLQRNNKTGSGKTDFYYDTHSQYTRKIVNLNNSGVFVDSTVFAYDGVDRRVLKSYKYSSNLYYTLYLFGSSDNILEERYRNGSAGTETVRQYIYGPTGLLAIRDNATDYFVLKDHLGSTRVAFNGSTGAVVAWFDYSPYGKVARSFETSTMIRYTYTGQERDSETGLMNYKARMYDPAIGRFYAMDPKGQTPSFYNYCGNNPVSFTDPSGEWFWLLPIIAGGVMNATLNADRIHNFNQFSLYFGLGALSGSVSYFSGGGTMAFNSTVTKAIEAGMRKFAMSTMAGALWNIGYQRSGLSDNVRKSNPGLDLGLNIFGPALLEGAIAYGAGYGEGVKELERVTSAERMNENTLVPVDKAKLGEKPKLTTKGKDYWQQDEWHTERVLEIKGQKVGIREKDVVKLGINFGTHTGIYTTPVSALPMSDYSIPNSLYFWWKGICQDRSTMFLNDALSVSFLPSEIFSGRFDVGFYQHFLGAGYLDGSALYTGYLNYRKGRL